jgi:hypothetical protein
LKHLIRIAPSGLKITFFHLGFQNEFPGKIRKMEWQRENMAISGITKSFEPIN